MTLSLAQSVAADLTETTRHRALAMWALSLYATLQDLADATREAEERARGEEGGDE